VEQLINGLSQFGTVQLGGAILITVLLIVLIASFASRARVFCQYLEHMTGIELKPPRVKAKFKRGGRGAVRDMLIDLLIQEDLADPDRPLVTPDSKPDTSVFEVDR
jgi:hypothetical protein